MMMRRFRARSMSRFDKSQLEGGSNDLGDRNSVDGTSSSGSFDQFCADIPGDGFLAGSPCDPFWDDDSAGTSVESSPIGWKWSVRQKSRLGRQQSLPKVINSTNISRWEECDTPHVDDSAEDLSEVKMMKERFAKLLLGEDMSGGGNGVCSALAISNAITNLSASVLRELWHVGRLGQEHKARWQREISWLLSVSDHIVEFVPSSQVVANGSVIEVYVCNVLTISERCMFKAFKRFSSLAVQVMVTKPRSDVHIILPALGKLDSILMEAFDSFNMDYFNMAQGDVTEDNEDHSQLKQDDEWRLQNPDAIVNGLSGDARKHLQAQRENTSQVLKAALAINAQILSEMEVPSVYWEALPKNGKSSLGEALYRAITAETFSPDALIASIDASHEHNILEMVNRVEAATQTWQRKLQTRQLQVTGRDGKKNPKSSWGIPSDAASGLEKREELVDKAETLLVLLKQKFPGLPQTILDMHKIHYNKDVGQSILESYSRALENLAFNILTRIDDILRADSQVKTQPHVTKHRFKNPNNYLSRRNVRRTSLAKSATISGAVVSLRALYSMKLSEQIGCSAEDAKPSSDHPYAPSPGSLRATYCRKIPEHGSRSPGALKSDMKLGLEYNGGSPLRRGPLKNWSFSGTINGMRSPVSRD